MFDYFRIRYRRFRRKPYDPVLDFEDDGMSWNMRQRRNERGWRKHYRWVRTLPWQIQLLIGLAWLEAVAIAFGFGFFIGGGLLTLAAS